MLDAFQKAMTDFVLHKESDSTLFNTIKHYDSRELESRLAIYRNNTYYSLIEALKDLYPSVVSTIGEQLFADAGREFLQHNPPNSPAMVDFGQEFPAFIKEHEATASFAYLSDLANLDLMRHQSYHAADDTPVAAEVYAQMDINSLAESKIEAIDSVRVLSSAYAVFDIWQLANNEIDQQVDASVPQCTLSIRPDTEVQLYLMSLGNYIFFQALLSGETINQALENALEQEEHFNPTDTISFLIQSGFAANIIGDHT